MRIFRLLILVSLSLFHTNASVSATTIAFWRFEEGSPNAVASGANTIIDSSSNALTGSPFDSPVYRNVPNLNSSLGLQFTGANLNQQRITIADNPLLAITQSLTLEAFIRFDGTPTGTQFFSQIVFRGDDRAALDPYFLAIDLNGHLVFHIENTTGIQANLVSPNLVPVGQFIHVAGTIDDITGQQRIFVNGVQVASQVTNIRPFGALNAGFLPGVGIGNVQSGNFRESFGGVIDDVRISNVALSPFQFLNATTVPEPKTSGLLVLGLLAYFLAIRLSRVIRDKRRLL